MKFNGLAFSEKTDGLFIVSDLSPWFNASCNDPLRVDDIPQINTKISTVMDSLLLSLDVSYYVQIAAVNSIGIGPFVSTTPAAETPRALPELAQQCKVFYSILSPFITGQFGRS